MARPQPTDGARMVYLIKRKTEPTREELIAHWFANHMPGVIARKRLASPNRALSLPDVACHLQQRLLCPYVDLRCGTPWVSR